MKINWGWGLAIFLTIFMISILSFVFFTTTQQINLVEEDYYPKGINYQDKIEQKTNADKLSGKIKAEQQAQTVIVSFPAEMRGTHAKGKLHFSHIEDYKLDLKVPLALDAEARQIVSTESLVAGRYILKVSWKANATDYYQEINIRIK